MLKRISALLMTLVLVFLVGCQKENHLAQAKPAVSTPEDTPVVLKILTEKHPAGYEYRLGWMMETLIETYTAEHPNVTFEVEYLPNTAEEREQREIRIGQLRYEILAGNGPDIYLLTDYYVGEPLFTDLNVVMRNGVFHELSAYYNADEELHTEELKQEVMDAGTYGDARYILPLSYDMPVLQVNDAVLENYGLDQEQLTANITSFLDTVWEAVDRTGELRLAQCIHAEEIIYLERFGQILDYDSNKVLLSAQELADWMQQSMEREEREYFLRNEDAETFESLYIGLDSAARADLLWCDSGAPALVTDAKKALETAFFAKAQGKEISLYPLRANDGSLWVDVTCWAAVGSGCDYADVAYDFLRGFLIREMQWDTERSEKMSTKFNPYFCWDGLPVRTAGAIDSMLDRMKLYIDVVRVPKSSDGEEFYTEKENLLSTELTAADFPLVDAKIDHVHFENIHDVNIQLLMNDWFDNFTGKAIDVDYKKEAADFIRDLEFFLAES